MPANRLKAPRAPKQQKHAAAEPLSPLLGALIIQVLEKHPSATALIAAFQALPHENRQKRPNLPLKAPSTSTKERWGRATGLYPHKGQPGSSPSLWHSKAVSSTFRGL